MHISLNFLSSKPAQMAQRSFKTCHGSGRIQREEMERKIETKIVTALMFSHSGNLKLASNARVRINPLPLPSPPPLQIPGSVNQGDVPNKQDM